VKADKTWQRYSDAEVTEWSEAAAFAQAARDGLRFTYKRM
jgi:hypothetical protein